MARHLKRRIAGASLAFFSLIQAGTAQAHQKLTSRDIKDHSLTFNDFKQGEVASAASISHIKVTLKNLAIKWNGTITDVSNMKDRISELSSWKVGADSLFSSMKDSIADLGSWKLDVASWKLDISSWKLDTDASLSEFKQDYMKIDSARSEFLKIDGTAKDSIKWNGLTTDQVVQGDGSVRTGFKSVATSSDNAQDLVTFGKSILISGVSVQSKNSARFFVKNLTNHALELVQQGGSTVEITGGQTKDIEMSLAGGGGLSTLQVLDPSAPALSITLTLSALPHDTVVDLHATAMGSEG